MRSGAGEVKEEESAERRPWLMRASIFTQPEGTSCFTRFTAGLSKYLPDMLEAPGELGAPPSSSFPHVCD